MAEVTFEEMAEKVNAFFEKKGIAVHSRYFVCKRLCEAYTSEIFEEEEEETEEEEEEEDEFDILNRELENTLKDSPKEPEKLPELETPKPKHTAGMKAMLKKTRVKTH